MYEEGFSKMVVLKHVQAAETREGIGGQCTDGHIASGNSPPLAKGEEAETEDVFVAVAEVEPIFEPFRLQHPLCKQHGVEVMLLVDEDLSGFLLPFVATRYSDRRPDRIVG